MAQLYLYVNAALYLFLAVWSTVAPRSTSAGLGYLEMSDRGRSEYLVVYGGLQVGVAIMFFLLARSPGSLPLGLRIAVGFYAPVVLYRVISALMNRPVSGSTLGTIGLEAFLLMAAIALLYTSST